MNNKMTIVMDSTYWQKKSNDFRHAKSVGEYPDKGKTLNWIKKKGACNLGIPVEEMTVVDVALHHSILPRQELLDDSKRCTSLVHDVSDWVDLGIRPVLYKLAPANNGKKYFEKEVDVGLALDAYATAIANQVSIVALVAGDRDFRPLLDRLSASGIKTLLVCHPGTTSKRLADAATYTVSLHDEIEKDPDLCSEIFGVYMPQAA